jgi:hypothetical protein
MVLSFAIRGRHGIPPSNASLLGIVSQRERSYALVIAGQVIDDLSASRPM